MDIASLGIKIDTSDAATAVTDLDKVTQAGAKAEKAAEGVAAGFEKASSAANDLSTTEKKLAESTDDAKARLLAMAKASLESSEYVKSLTTSTQGNTAALDAARSSGTDYVALQKRFRAESDALVGTTDKAAASARQAAAATGVQAEGLQALLAKINPVAGALGKLDEQQAQLQKYKNAGVIDAETFKDYSSQIEGARQKVGAFGEELKKGGVSAGQTANALRQLPAQFTDIFTSLAGGQNPLMVLIQQGGQIKDSFGGIGNTFDVLGAKIKAMFSGGAGAAVLGESLAGIAANSKDVADKAGDASAGLSGLAESSNTAAEAASNASKAVGSISPSVSAASMSMLGMVGAVAAVVAVVGVLAYSYSQGSKETDAYNQSLILTGNYAGTTSGQLADMARQISATNGTVGQAAETLAKLAGSGVIAGESFQAVAEAASLMEDATGKSVDATIAEFVKIGKDPVAAAKDLNEQYNFLTASVYAQIVALKDQGDTISAAKLLTDTYADTVQSRSKQITDNLNLWQKAWKGIKDTTSDVVDGLNNVGREKTYEDQIKDLKARLTGSSAYDVGGVRMNAGAVSPKDRADIQGQISFLELQRDAEKSLGQYTENRKVSIRAANDAQDYLNAGLKSAKSNAEKLADEYAKIDAKAKASALEGVVYSQKQIDLLRAAAAEKLKDPKGPANQLNLTVFNDAQNSLKTLQDTYSNTEKQLDASQKAGLISASAYAVQKSVLINAEKEQVTAAYEAEISALEAVKAKSGTTAEQRISLDQKIADARTSMVKAQKDADSQQEVLATAEKGRLDKQTYAIDQYVQALSQQQKALALAGQRAVVGVGRGDRQNTLDGQLNSQQDRYAQQSLDLENQRSDPSRNMDPEEFKKKSQALADANKAATDQIQQNYADVEAAQGDWTKGATSAWENYLDSAKNIAGQTKSLFGNAFSSMEDAVVNFAMTGKLSFADFAKSIIADMARIATRQASSALLSSLVGAATSYFGGSSAGGNGLAAGSAGATSSSLGASSAGYSSNYFPQAKGGAWGSGVQLFADGGAFSNSVVSTPTAFGMSSGKTGVMGEAGPEAIMPLTRTSSGALGVRALGGGSSSGTTISVQVMVASDGSTSSTASDPAYQQFGKDLADFVDQRYQKLVSKDLGQGGRIKRAITG